MTSMPCWRAAGLTFLLFGCGPSAVVPEPTVDSGARYERVWALSGDADAGAAVYLSACAGCHSKNSAAVCSVGARQVVRAALFGLPEGAADGGPYTMPPLAGRLSDQDLADLASLCAPADGGTDAGP